MRKRREGGVRKERGGENGKWKGGMKEDNEKKE